MGQPITLVDAFTDRPFAGNPAAVCLLSGPADDGWMQAVAAEMNLSETAFLHPEEDGFRLRWFTPAAEVDLCGHATLASAHVLWSEGHLRAGTQARFCTRSGLLTADLHDDWIALDFPSTPAQAAVAPTSLEEILGTRVQSVARSRFDLLIELESEQAVRSLAPDIGRLATLPIRGFIVTSRARDPQFDFVSRFFAPSVGVAEDPVTGSAHCCLGPYWGERLGKTELVGYQVSRRGGIVRVQLRGDRVGLLGQAVTVLRGELWCGPARERAGN